MNETTFAVSPDVKRGKPLEPIDVRVKLPSTLRGRIEAMWKPSSTLVSCEEDHALLTAIRQAFYEHYPLRLSPDVVWITLARGFALHVNQHAEELRERFVRHAGQEKLTVERLDFLPGRENPWHEAFEAFSDQIAARVGKLRDFVRCDFSTTGLSHRTVSDLMVMDTFKAYFEYEMMCGCGIPSITLTGTVDDWKSIRQRARLFGEFGLEQWSRALDPILEKFVEAAQGGADPEFWRSLFRYHGGSGPAVMTGWITVFFPYLKDEKENLYENPYFEDWQRRLEIDDKQHWRDRWNDPQGVGMGAVPPCLTSVPLKVTWGAGEPQMMRLIGGLIGVSQHSDTLALEPECGWAIVEDDVKSSSLQPTQMRG